MGAGTIGAGGIGTLAAGARGVVPDGNKSSLLAAPWSSRSRPSRPRAVPTEAPTNDPAGRVRRGRAGRYRGNLGSRVLERRTPVSRTGPGPLRGLRCARRAARRHRRADRSIARGIRRSISICRSSASSIGDSEPPVISRRPMSWRTRSAIMCKPCSASIGRCRKRSRAVVEPAPTRCRCSSSCRRIALPACGDITPTRSSCWIRAMSTRDLSAAAAIGDDRLTRRPRVARELYARHVRTARPLAAPGPADRATSTAAIRLNER